MPPRLPGTNITSIARTSASDKAFFFICFMVLKSSLSFFDFYVLSASLKSEVSPPCSKKYTFWNSFFIFSFCNNFHIKY